RINLAGEALIDAVGEPVELTSSPRGAVEILLDLPGNFAATTDCPVTQLLVVNESFHTGWKAVIDGQTAKILRTNGDFLGLVVPAGLHEIRFNFEPESLNFGRLASTFGVGLMIVTLLLLRATSLRASKRLALDALQR